MKKTLFVRFFCLFVALLLMVSLIGCGGSDEGSKYAHTPTAGDATIVQSLVDVNPSTDLNIKDGASFGLDIPSYSTSSRYSIDVTKKDLVGKDEAAIAVEAKKLGLPEGYFPTSSFYNINIRIRERGIPSARAAIAMNTSVWLKKQASILLFPCESLDWETFDYHVAVLDGGNGKDTWYLIPVSKSEVTGSNAFKIQSNSLGKAYCIVKKAKGTPTPAPDPTPDVPEEKVVVNSLVISADPTSINTNESNKFAKDVSVSLKVSYSGNIDSKNILSKIKLYSHSNFEFLGEVKAKNEGGLYLYTSELTKASTGAGEIIYTFTIPVNGQDYDVAKHPESLFVDASFNLDSMEYRPKQPVDISIVAPVTPLPNPEVIPVLPLDGATDIPISTVVVLTFSEKMANTLSANDFSLKVGEADAALSSIFEFELSSNKVTFTPKAELAYGTKYELTAKTSILSANNMPLKAEKTISFTTVNAEVPLVCKVFPANGDVIWFDKEQNTENNKIVIGFTQKMDLESLKKAFTFFAENKPLPSSDYSIELSEDKKEMIVSFSSGSFSRSVAYYFTLENSATSEEGKKLVNPQSPLTINYVVKDFARGSGTEDEPYEIYTAADLDKLTAVAIASNTYCVQKADIDLTGYVSEKCTEGKGWDADWQATNINYDGNYHKITGLYINRPEKSFVGLFGWVRGKISNLAVELDPRGIKGYEDVGGLVGLNDGATISNCSVNGNVSGNIKVGGLVGESSGVVSYSYAIGRVESIESDGDAYVGGLVGCCSEGGNITNCYASADVSAENNYVGGLIGGSQAGSIIANCYATGNVSGQRFVGGLLGRFDATDSNCSNCYATGDVTASKDVGGVVGFCKKGEVSNCVGLNSKVSGNSNCSRVVGSNGGTITNCYASGAMKNKDDATFSDGSTTDKNGASIDESSYYSKNWWLETAKWSDNTWFFVDGKLPVLSTNHSSSFVKE